MVEIEMGNKWILDVLSDLELFAADNGMPGLAEQLGKSAKIASEEILRPKVDPTMAGSGDYFGPRKISADVGERSRA